MKGWREPWCKNKKRLGAGAPNLFFVLHELAFVLAVGAMEVIVFFVDDFQFVGKGKDGVGLDVVVEIYEKLATSCADVVCHC